MLTAQEVALLYRSHAAAVRRFLRRYRRSVQEADLHDIEQTVWLNLATRGQRDALENPAAYLTQAARYAVMDFFRHKRQPIRDERQSQPLDDDQGSGPIELGYRQEPDAGKKLDEDRTRRRVRALRGALDADEAATFDRVMVQDFDDAPKKERDKVVAMTKRVLALPPQPRSVERPDVVEGPSHCGRTVKRLGLAVEDSRERDETLDAAE